MLFLKIGSQSAWFGKGQIIFQGKYTPLFPFLGHHSNRIATLSSGGGRWIQQEWKTEKDSIQYFVIDSDP